MSPLVTGIGAVTPQGEDPAALARAVQEGRPGTFVTPSVAGVSPGAAGPVGLIADPDPEEFLEDRKALKYMDALARLAVRAAGLAFRDAGLDPRTLDRTRVGVFMAIGHVASELRDLRPILTAGRGADGRFDPALLGERCRINPLSVFRSLPNIPACNVSIAFGLRGESTVTYPDSVQAASALDEALDSLAAGRIDVALFGGAFQATNFLTLHTLRMLGLAGGLDGVPPSDGAGVLVLESAAHAAARGARTHGRILGVEVTSGTAPAPRLHQRAITAVRMVGSPPPSLVVADGDGRPPTIEAMEAGLRGAGLDLASCARLAPRRHLGRMLAADLPLDIALALALPGEGPALILAGGYGPEAAACLVERGPA